MVASLPWHMTGAAWEGADGRTTAAAATRPIKDNFITAFETLKTDQEFTLDGGFTDVEGVWRADRHVARVVKETGSRPMSPGMAPGKAACLGDSSGG